MFHLKELLLFQDKVIEGRFPDRKQGIHFLVKAEKLYAEQYITVSSLQGGKWLPVGELIYIIARIEMFDNNYRYFINIQGILVLEKILWNIFTSKLIRLQCYGIFIAIR